MANETKKTATESTEAAAEVTAATPERRLMLEREKFTLKDGREMWGYAVYGNVRGRETKVDFKPYDQGGYEVLDMIFDIEPKVGLEVHDETMTDSETGEVRSFTVYTVGNADEYGDQLSCRVKPARDSDKSILAYLLKKLNRRESTGALEAAK